ncbi:hypothetical protein E1B28_001901 [Marasmius oreades]|uniref:Uncharacterized protein n=1 Tax=Marasmius oreades TaxID=181124 RepID=A0A9P8AFN7_9AGAR|nr:uncharacterized protein E1B28_001901 [Marasmius oreades]KAG7100121.1 hypothetical protein E1B28_001901 [Marasmius oreades]
MPKIQRTALNVSRAVKRNTINADLKALDALIDTTCAELAVKHKKKKRYFLDAVYQNGVRLSSQSTPINPYNAWKWAKANELHGVGITNYDMTDIARVFGHEYSSLSSEQKKGLVDQYREHKSRNQKYRTPTARSRAQDIAQIYLTVKKLLASLQKGSGVETVLIMVKNWTENVMQPTCYFSNPLMEPFMKTATWGGWDTRNVAAKLEVFALAGFDSSKLYTKRADVTQELKNEIRDFIKANLAEVSGKEKPTMHYEEFDKLITLQNGIVLENWPIGDFCNPSRISNNIEILHTLRDSWWDGQTYFCRLLPEEFADWKKQYQDRLADGSIPPKQRKMHVDAGCPRKKATKATEADQSLSNSDNDPPSNDEPTSIPQPTLQHIRTAPPLMTSSDDSPAVHPSPKTGNGGSKKTASKDRKDRKENASHGHKGSGKKTVIAKKVKSKELVEDTSDESVATGVMEMSMNDSGATLEDGAASAPLVDSSPAHVNNSFNAIGPAAVVDRNFLSPDFLPNNILDVISHPLMNPIVYDLAKTYIMGSDPTLNTYPDLLAAWAQDLGPFFSEDQLKPLIQLIWACDNDRTMDVNNRLHWIDCLFAQCTNFVKGLTKVLSPDLQNLQDLSLEQLGLSLADLAAFSPATPANSADFRAAALLPAPAPLADSTAFSAAAAVSPAPAPPADLTATAVSPTPAPPANSTAFSVAAVSPAPAPPADSTATTVSPAPAPPADLNAFSAAAVSPAPAPPADLTATAVSPTPAPAIPTDSSVTPTDVLQQHCVNVPSSQQNSKPVVVANLSKRCIDYLDPNNIVEGSRARKKKTRVA